MKNLSKLLISIIGCELVGIAGTPFTAAAIPSEVTFEQWLELFKLTRPGSV